jgi:hypothetical protein
MHEEACRMVFHFQLRGLTEEICQLRNWQIFGLDYPVLDVGFKSRQAGEIRIRMQCQAYNEQPPSVELLSMDGKFLTDIKRDPGGVFNPGPHPITGRPFICMRGSREYHTHPSHVTDQWESLKTQSGYDLGGLVTQVWRAWSRIH